MSAGIIVMNENGVALAADSAVTCDNEVESGHFANKLFSISKTNPVGAIVYENAEFMQTPMGDIIAQYVSDRGNQSFPTLKEHVVDFLAHLEASPALRAKERDHVLKVCGEIVKKCAIFVKGDNKALAEFCDGIDRMPPLNLALNEETCDSTYFYDYIHDNYEDDIAKEIQNVVGEDLDDARLKLLILTICDSFSKCCFDTGWTGIAFAGYGSDEDLPQLYHLALDGIVGGKVQYMLWPDTGISEQNTCKIVPLAQTDVIKTLLTGVDETLVDQLDDNARITAMEVMNNNLQPIKESIADPKFSLKDMASFAETMIDITSLRRKLVKDEKYGTVGGPTDVAVITKGDGFAWVQHKKDSNTAQ